MRRYRPIRKLRFGCGLRTSFLCERDAHFLTLDARLTSASAASPPRSIISMRASEGTTDTSHSTALRGGQPSKIFVHVLCMKHRKLLNLLTLLPIHHRRHAEAMHADFPIAATAAVMGCISTMWRELASPRWAGKGMPPPDSAGRRLQTYFDFFRPSSAMTPASFLSSSAISLPNSPDGR
jgi:hypothetical protein